MKTHLTGLVICILLGIVLMLGLNTIGWLARSLVQGSLIGLLMFVVWEVARWMKR
ncbi:hypothetical protein PAPPERLAPAPP_03990 [Brevundimonas phage vB_BpoS-Papperlapapp]|uniref:Uncharacterized protein n=2 Tax=Marchewkavirus TaxID=3425052 RepID=A0A9E7MP72_9CAUD|nr:hypothetical protein KABACHOK_02370 [Brevundimonas phage vB_BpoS-Kabachok]USN14768.1 hypothetical protein DOMOVOI_02940 [Brevundimonas phage vB_BpoS-Domovoi]USN16140.1 hypothetical protein PAPPERLAPAPP_03990 [Brevundimonas phage vB_BpoS-Papperlapapp]